MTTRDPKLRLVLIVLCLGAGVYFSIRLLTPPASAATSQDQQATNQDADDAQTAAAKFYLWKRLPEGEKEIPIERYLDARAEMLRMERYAIVFHPQYNGASNKTLFVSEDGGIYKTDDALAATATGTTAPCDPSKSAVQWSSLNNDYAATQLYNGAPYPDGARYLAGANSHGFLRGADSNGVNGWRQMLGGDGGFVAIDHANANVIYTATSGGFIRKSSDGGRTFAAAFNGIADPGFVYIAPLAPDPSGGARLWTGGPMGDGGPAVSARLTAPRGVAFDNAGNLFIVSELEGRVRRVSFSTGIITTVAGGGDGGLGDGGPAVSAKVYPYGLAFDGANNLVLADTGNYRVRRISPESHPQAHSFPTCWRLT